MDMISHRIPLITPEMYRDLPDQTTEILNRLIEEVNGYQLSMQELANRVIVLQNEIKNLQPSPTPPTPSGEYRQLIAFNPSQMTSTPEECLKNVMAGFGISLYPGGSIGAFEDMLYNQSQGKLHEEVYPPADIAVPIYIRTGAEHQHVVAWDHGVVYSDGVLINDWVTYFGEQNIYGWGELCDKIPVVEKTPS